MASDKPNIDNYAPFRVPVQTQMFNAQSVLARPWIEHWMTVARKAGRSLTWRGTWDATLQYAVNDWVLSTDGMKAWIAVEGNTNSEPADASTVWQLMFWCGRDQPTRGFGATFDGGGSPLSAGLTAYALVPKGGTISAWSILVDTGTCTITVWKKPAGTAIPTVADSISRAGLAITTGTAIRSTTVTDFTTLAVADGDIVAIHLSAVSGATKIFFNVEMN